MEKAAPRVSFCSLEGGSCGFQALASTPPSGHVRSCHACLGTSCTPGERGRNWQDISGRGTSRHLLGVHGSQQMPWAWVTAHARGKPEPAACALSVDGLAGWEFCFGRAPGCVRLQLSRVPTCSLALSFWGAECLRGLGRADRLACAPLLPPLSVHLRVPRFLRGVVEL